MKHGRFKEPNPDIYSETEIEYYVSTLKKLNEQKYKEDLTKGELSHTIKQHY